MSALGLIVVGTVIAIVCAVVVVCVVIVGGRAEQELEEQR